MTKDQLTKAIELLKTETYESVAKELGVKPENLRWHLRKIGFKKNPKLGKRLTPHFRARVSASVSQIGRKKAAEKNGISLHTVDGITKRAKNRAKNAANALESKIPKLMAQAKRFARVRLMDQYEREEFVSMFLEQLAKGNSQSFDQVLVDYYRLKLGRYGHKNVEHTKIEHSGAETSPDQSSDFIHDVERMCGGDLRSRVLLIGKFLLGLQDKEVGLMIGVSESRVCQMFDELFKKLRKRKVY